MFDADNPQEISQGTDDPTLVRVAQLALPFSCVTGSFAYGIGVGPVIYAVNGELFPPSVKGICSATALLLRCDSALAFPVLNLLGLEKEKILDI